MYAILAPMYGSETDQVYERAGWGSRVTRGSRPAIIVVDLSRGFTEPEFPTGADLTPVVEATTQLIEAARGAEVPVIFTTIAYEPADVEGGACAWLRKAPGLGILRAGSELVDLDPRLPYVDGDPVIVKRGASAFFGTDLGSSLVARKIDTAVVCGATTSGCVRATAVDAVQGGFGVLVPRACVGDRAAGPHEASLFDIDAKYGDVIDLADALQYVADPRKAASPL